MKFKDARKAVDLEAVAAAREQAMAQMLGQYRGQVFGAALELLKHQANHGMTYDTAINIVMEMHKRCMTLQPPDTDDNGSKDGPKLVL